MVIGEGLVDSGEDTLGDLLAHFQRVVTIDQNLWLDNGHQSIHLTDRGISSQNIGIFLDC